MLSSTVRHSSTLNNAESKHDGDRNGDRDDSDDACHLSILFSQVVVVTIDEALLRTHSLYAFRHLAAIQTIESFIIDKCDMAG